MPTLKSLLNDYLSKEDIISLIESYDNKKHDKNQLILSFLNKTLLDIIKLLNVKEGIPLICGYGSVGCVVSLESTKFTFDNFEKQSTIPLYRIKKSKLCNEENLPKQLALKIQIFDTNDKYWEARVLREEFIQNKISEYTTFNDVIPKFYFGCTINMPIQDDIIRFRLTFMDLIDIQTYTSLLKYLESRHGNLPDIIYKKIETLAHNLWKNDISHNDLSVNNILIDHDNNIKLVDFGLSCIINGGLDESNLNLVEKYNNYFETLDKSEQNGSNVAKLNELFQYVKK
jgi:serine/threonine protein kinase